MRITHVQLDPIVEFPFLNAGKGAGAYYVDRLPVHIAEVDQLPNGLDALLATADLQGRERFQDAGKRPLRLLGETLPARLSAEVLPLLELDPARTGVLLAGDFYTVPALDRRGGTGDVTSVWRAFVDEFAWVAGVAGNHDQFGASPDDKLRLAGPVHYLDGTRATISGLKIAGVGGIIGNPRRHMRRSEDQYLAALEKVLQSHTDIALLHDGPDDPVNGQRGSPRVRLAMEQLRPRLVVRGHAHWNQPLVELAGGVQVLNVDARAVLLRRACPG